MDMISITSLVKDERGVALVEYGLLLAIMAVACVATLTVVGTTVKSFFSTVANSL